MLRGLAGGRRHVPNVAISLLICHDAFRARGQAGASRRRQREREARQEDPEHVAFAEGSIGGQSGLALALA